MDSCGTANFMASTTQYAIPLYKTLVRVMTVHKLLRVRTVCRIEIGTLNSASSGMLCPTVRN